MTVAADQRLEQIVAVVTGAEQSAVAATVECGRLCHEYIVQHTSQGVSRPVCTKAIADALKKSGYAAWTKINRSIGAYWVCRLLGDGATPEMSARCLREFNVLIRRDRRSSEAWTVRHGREDFAMKLFLQASREHMDAKDVHRAIRGAGKKHQRAAKQHELPDPPERCTQLVHPAVSISSPKDAAELLYATILENADPLAVARHLEAMLNAKQFKADVREKQRKERWAS